MLIYSFDLFTELYCCDIFSWILSGWLHHTAKLTLVMLQTDRVLHHHQLPLLTWHHSHTDYTDIGPKHSHTRRENSNFALHIGYFLVDCAHTCTWNYWNRTKKHTHILSGKHTRQCSFEYTRSRTHTHTHSLSPPHTHTHTHTHSHLVH